MLIARLPAQLLSQYDFCPCQRLIELASITPRTLSEVRATATASATTASRL